MKQFFTVSKAYPWYTEQNIWFHGCILTETGCLRKKEAVDYIRNALNEQGVSDALCGLNGVFSFICEQNEQTIMAVDRLRSLPLFYAVWDGELYVGDDAESIVRALPHVSLNRRAVEAYQTTKLYTLGADTMLQELRQVQAGSFCVFESDTAQLHEMEYFHMEPGKMETDLAVLTRDFQSAYWQVGRHLVEALNGRTAVVPLSGGADSRMILSMLKEQNYEKVLCFTYGCPGNQEAQISKEVAAYFGYPWEFVPYNKAICHQVGASEELEQYCRKASSYVSTPHLQDFIAVKVLHESGKLPADSVFVPGHSGDMIAGSHISAKYLQSTLSRTEFLEDIIEHFLVEKLTPVLMQDLEERFPVMPDKELEEMAAQSAWFNVQERQAKFIVNSVRVYEFFGYEWLIPLWDNTLFDFWAKVPIDWKFQRKLYFTVINGDVIPSTNDVTLYRQLCNKVRSMPGLRTAARRMTRILRYWRSALCLEKMFSLGEYLPACIKENELFDCNYLLCNRQVQYLKGQYGNGSSEKSTCD